jgi:hypothetical protein
LMREKTALGNSKSVGHFGQAMRGSHLLHHPKSLGCTSADKMLQAFFKMSRCRRR